MGKLLRMFTVSICVLIACAVVNAQDKVVSESKGPTQNPVAKTATPSEASGYVVRIVDTLPPPAPKSARGRWLSVTRWNGKQWVKKLEWFPDRVPRKTGPQPIELF